MGALAAIRAASKAKLLGKADRVANAPLSPFRQKLQLMKKPAVQADEEIDYGQAAVDSYRKRRREEAVLDPFSAQAREETALRYNLRDVDENISMEDMDLYDGAFSDISSHTGVPEGAMGLGSRTKVRNLTPATRQESGAKDTTLGLARADRDKPELLADVERTVGGVQAKHGITSTIYHEWFHTLDNYLFTMFTRSGREIMGASGKRLADVKKGEDVPSNLNILKKELDKDKQEAFMRKHITSQDDFESLGYATQMGQLTGMRPELAEKWYALRNAVVGNQKSAFGADARRLDATLRPSETNTYYADPSEMMSRAFESYMEYKKSDKYVQRARRYMNEAELEEILPLFDSFFKEMKFAKGTSRQGNPTTFLYGGAGLALVPEDTSSLP